MADLTKFYESRGTEKAIEILAKAAERAKNGEPIDVDVLQSEEFKLGHGEATIVMDWLADNNEIETHVSNHWIRCGRAYVRNAMTPSLGEMAQTLEIGEKRAFLVMQVLEKRKIIRIKDDFSFERIGRMASFADLVRQMKVVGKKYRGRCEPILLARTMYIDPITAVRLAQYGEENLGYLWKRRAKEFL